MSDATRSTAANDPAIKATKLLESKPEDHSADLR